MTFSAEVIEDSVQEDGFRLTTLQLRYPRFIHAEFMTHRMFSRNASSSRAVPVAKLIEDVRRDPAMPIYWGKNQPGMQAREQHFEPVIHPAAGYKMSAQEAWLESRAAAVRMAEAYAAAGYHKQVVNRLLEPFAHINVVVTATEWENFFAQRIHPDAQPEMQELAWLMKTALDRSVPVERKEHLPYVGELERRDIDYTGCAMLSAARCARTSYMTHDRRQPEFAEDYKLAQKLWSAPHPSPFEHQARKWTSHKGFIANFRGWYQFRHDEDRWPKELTNG